MPTSYLLRMRPKYKNINLSAFILYRYFIWGVRYVKGASFSLTANHVRSRSHWLLIEFSCESPRTCGNELFLHCSQKWFKKHPWLLVGFLFAFDCMPTIRTTWPPTGALQRGTPQWVTQRFLSHELVEVVSLCLTAGFRTVCDCQLLHRTHIGLSPTPCSQAVSLFFPLNGTWTERFLPHVCLVLLIVGLVQCCTWLYVAWRGTTKRRDFTNAADRCYTEFCDPSKSVTRGGAVAHFLQHARVSSVESIDCKI